MSIPLERLYHYISSLNTNIIIYRWAPHGSKKLEDLSFDDTVIWPSDTLEKFTTPRMICHDQEPLNYNYYSKEDFLNNLESRHNKINQNFGTWSKANWWQSELFIDTLVDAHLRSALDYPTMFHDYVMLCHSEKNSKELELYEANGFVGVYYWSHAVIARDWYRYAEHDLQLGVDFNKIAHDFLIYNRAWSGTREYRLKFVEEVITNNLQEKCLLKFNQTDEGNHYTNHKFKNPTLQITSTDIEKFLPENTATSGASADYVNKDYQTCAIEVVLETLFDDSRSHLTEKTLRPIACGRPFMLAATPGSLKYLQSYGFKTFGEYINESYDDIVDPVERIQAIVSEMNRISSLDTSIKQNLWVELYKIAEFNKQRFFSDQFQQDVVDELLSNINIALVKCNQHMSGRFWKMATDLTVIGNPVPETEFLKSTYAWLDNKNKITHRGE